jgi:hypothetical protein
MWTLRVRANGETTQLHSVDPEAPFGALQARIADVVKIPAPDQRILAGFPPRALELPEASATGAAAAASGPSVAAMGIVNCDTLTVAQRADAPHQSVAAPPPQKRRKKAGSSTAGAGASTEGGRSWEEGVAESLVAAASSSSSELEAELVPMRKALKEHLRLREQERLANQRLSALLSGAFEMEMLLGGRLSDSMPSLQVSFAVGPRKVHTEDVLMMGKAMLRAIVQKIVEDPDARENLRLFNMAFFSPRVFWSLVYHYHDAADSACDMEARLMALAPSADWSFLAARKRNLSERALEASFTEAEEKRRRDAASAARAARAAKKTLLAAPLPAGEGQPAAEADGPGSGEAAPDNQPAADAAAGQEDEAQRSPEPLTQ